MSTQTIYVTNRCCSASASQYETEVRGERVAAGQAAARAKGKRWGGSIAGVRKKVTPTQEKIIRAIKPQREPVTAIAAAVGLSRPTIYDVLAVSVHNDVRLGK